jgi:hypothetical protein
MSPTFAVVVTLLSLWSLWCPWRSHNINGHCIDITIKWNIVHIADLTASEHIM